LIELRPWFVTTCGIDACTSIKDEACVAYERIVARATGENGTGEKTKREQIERAHRDHVGAFGEVFLGVCRL